MTNTEQKAVWKPYPDYPFIEANQFGEIRTKDRVVTYSDGRKRLVKGRVLKQLLNHHGYLTVHVSVNSKSVRLLVHRIVATCFIPNPNGYPEVNHKDNDRTNNAVNNLEWCTSQYNNDYKKNFGTTSAEVLGRSVIAINPETFEVLWFESQRKAARQLGTYHSSVSDVIKGRYSQTYGWWFTNADSEP